MRNKLQLSLLGVALAAPSFAQTQVATMPPETAIYTGSTRGYWFTAASDFTITGVRVLESPSGTNTFQNFAIVRFDNQTSPPAYSATTNAFTQLALGLDLDRSVFQPVNVPVSAGDVMGIYGNSAPAVATTTGRNSYAGGMQATTVIDGISTDLFRSGMQFHLGSATSPQGMHDVWSEPPSFNISRVEFEYVTGPGNVGVAYCGPAVVNSTGNPAEMFATGSASVAMNNLVLGANELPTNAFGFFLTSQTQGMVPTPGGSQGTLCLGGQIGRYVGMGQIQNSGAMGEIMLPVDLGAHPTPNGLVQVNAGETWNFQAWFRDSTMGGQATSNFTNGLEVLFN